MNGTTLYWNSVASPIGTCSVLASEAGVCWLGLPTSNIEEGIAHSKRWLKVAAVKESEELPVLRQAVEELRGYFSGELHQFNCRLDILGTPFQREVWEQLWHILYGETRTYGEIARTIGRPAASRAVGAANGANPIAIILPCHRVIGGNGNLTGYGGGLPAKAWLLELEGVTTFRS